MSDFNDSQASVIGLPFFFFFKKKSNGWCGDVGEGLGVLL